ncbi:MAG: glycosyl transferase [Syntrophobacter sp. DG_60]|nr:MAG: glycosyl transferase [Syntrophobacter sp. DG_60]
MDISVVIPVYNEEASLKPLYAKLKKTLEEINRPYEIIFIDDGSKDSSWEILKHLRKQDKNIKLIRLTRNFGQTAAITAGFEHAEGKITIGMDADLQNEPADIPYFLAKIEEGYDLVSGWRRYRQDALITRKVPSWIANWLISKITGVKLHDYGCSLKAYKSWVVKNLHLYGEMHRFIPALARWCGAQITEIEVRHYPRRFGQAKYGLSRTLKVILDLITVKFLLSYSTKPLHFFGIPGAISFLAGFFICSYLSVLKFFYHVQLSQRPLLLLGVLLIFMGIQFISLGLLAELVIRIYHEAQKRPIYGIKEILK